MKFIQTVDGFFNFCHKHHCKIESLHCGNAVYYLAFYLGQVVAQYVEYLPHPKSPKSPKTDDFYNPV